MLQRYIKKKRGYSFCDQIRQKSDEMAYLSDEQYLVIRRGTLLRPAQSPYYAERGLPL
jgi:hypothetical protein